MTVLDRLDHEAISTRARDIHFWRSVARLIAAMLFLIGWSVAKVFGLAWYAAAWSAVCLAEGWSAARKEQVKRGPARTG